MKRNSENIKGGGHQSRRRLADIVAEWRNITSAKVTNILLASVIGVLSLPTIRRRRMPATMMGQAVEYHDDGTSRVVAIYCWRRLITGYHIGIRRLLNIVVFSVKRMDNENSAIMSVRHRVMVITPDKMLSHGHDIFWSRTMSTAVCCCYHGNYDRHEQTLEKSDSMRHGTLRGIVTRDNKRYCFTLLAREGYY